MYCVITGASSGFGTEFAYNFAKRKYDLCLASRNLKKLKLIKSEIESKYKVKVDVIKTDVTKVKDMEKLHEFCKTKNVDVLINNAGILTGGLPSEIDSAAEAVMIDTNVKSVHYLTRLFLTEMIKKNKGKILNVSSLSAWTPTPLLSSYGACKSFILSFSEAINFELKKMKSKVVVSTVTPGFFNTNISGKDFTLSGQNRSINAYINNVVKAFLKGKKVIVLGKDLAIPILGRFIPRLWLQELAYSIVKVNLTKTA